MSFVEKEVKPATTMRPSDCCTTVLHSSKLVLTATMFVPAVAKVGSSSPVGK